jgi:hypothetical protein
VVNLVAFADLAIYAGQKGGAPATKAVVTLVRAYRDYAAGRIKLDGLLSEENLAAAAVVLSIFVEAVQDPGEISNIQTLVKSL